MRNVLAASIEQTRRARRRRSRRGSGALCSRGTIIAARQDSLLVSCFHPELTDDDRFHRAFLEQVRAHRPNAQPLAQATPAS